MMAKSPTSSSYCVDAKCERQTLWQATDARKGHRQREHSRDLLQLATDPAVLLHILHGAALPRSFDDLIPARNVSGIDF
jgi:hypothetical protein